MRKYWYLGLLLGVVILVVTRVSRAQAPPSTGGYTFQGQGNLAQIFSALANPQTGQVPFGTNLGSYSLLVPSGDLVPGTALGTFKVNALHLGTQNCASSPCPVASALVNCDASAGPILLQLPGAGGTGYFLSIQKTDTTANACTITAAGSDTINGLPTIPITTPYLSMLLADAQPGSWLAGLLTLATGSTGGTGFPLLGNGDFNNWSGINIGGLQLVKQPAPSNFGATSTCSGTCATTYTYEVTCLTAFGESGQLSSGSADTTTITNASSLTPGNNNSLSWTFQPQCRSGYNIYGRIGGALGLLIALPQTTTTWVDDGSIINPANNYTFSWSSAAYPAVTIWDLKGANITSPIDVTASASGGNSAFMTTASITTTQNHDLQVLVFGLDKASGTWTPPTGFTSTIAQAANSVTNYGLGLSQKDKTTAGATGGTSNSHTATAAYWASLNLGIKSSNTSVAVTVGSTPTYVATPPYNSVTFGDPSGTSTGDLELVCVSFQQGTGIQAPTAPASFTLAGSVISNTNKVQLNCYWNAPTIGGLPPPPSSNSTGSLTQITATGQIYNENLLGLISWDGNTGNQPNGAAASAVMRSTSFPVAMTVQGCRATWTGYNACSPTFPIFALKDITANQVLCSSGTVSATPTDTAVTPTATALPATDVLAFLATTVGAGCTTGGTSITTVLHQ